jgi:glycerophosphoryl diester phosphodiesterase
MGARVGHHGEVPTTPPPPRPIGFAHRGARAERRENTIDAFTRALELGATGLESDAWLTADGMVVLNHDGTTGPIWRRRDISDQNRTALPGHVPTLEQLYRKCGTGFELSLDLKDPAALAPILEVSEAAGATPRLWLCHHYWALVPDCGQVAGDTHLVESTSVNSMPGGIASRAAALAGVGVDAINLHGREWNEDRVAKVHAAGLRAFGWDAQTDRDIRRLVELGVDGLFSDHVGRMMSVIASTKS